MPAVGQSRSDRSLSSLSCAPMVSPWSYILPHASVSIRTIELIRFLGPMSEYGPVVEKVATELLYSTLVPLLP